MVMFPEQIKLPLLFVIVHPVWSEPPAKYISPVDELPILIAPVPLPLRDIWELVVDGYIDGEEPEKIKEEELNVLLFIVPETVRLSEDISPVAVILVTLVIGPSRFKVPPTVKDPRIEVSERTVVPNTSKLLLTVVVPRLGNPKVILFPLTLIPSGREKVVVV